MSMSQSRLASHQHTTPPSSFADHPLTPPRTDKKPFGQAQRVIALFKAIRDGRHPKQDPWTEFQLEPGEYDEIERQLGRDEALSGYVKDKIQYDYDANVNQLVVHMPTAIHELFVARVEDAIFSQLKSMRERAGAAPAFAQKVELARSTEIYFPVDDFPPGTKSKYEPDASFWHSDAEHPGVIFEIAYPQKKRKLGRLAEDYLLDSDANVQAVVDLDIQYSKKGSRKATLSVWRTHVFNTTDGDELRVVQEAADVTFCDDDGNPTDHPGLRLHLSDFAHKGLVQSEIGNQDQELIVSTEQLCQFLTAAEAKVHQRGSLSKDSLAPGVKKRNRSETPPEEITSGDEARYVEQEERAAKRMADDDSDHENTPMRSIPSHLLQERAK